MKPKIVQNKLWLARDLKAAGGMYSLWFERPKLTKYGFFNAVGANSWDLGREHFGITIRYGHSKPVTLVEIKETSNG